MKPTPLFEIGPLIAAIAGNTAKGLVHGAMGYYAQKGVNHYLDNSPHFAAKTYRHLSGRENFHDKVDKFKSAISEHPKTTAAIGAGGALLGTGIAVHKYLKSRKKK